MVFLAEVLTPDITKHNILPSVGVAWFPVEYENL